MQNTTTIAIATLLVTAGLAATASAGSFEDPVRVTDEAPEADGAGHYQTAGLLFSGGHGHFSGAGFFCDGFSPTQASLLVVEDDSGPDHIRLTYEITPCGLSATCSLDERPDGSFEGPCLAPWLEDGQANITDLRIYQGDPTLPLPEPKGAYVQSTTPTPTDGKYVTRAGPPAPAEAISYDLRLSGQLSEIPPQGPSLDLGYRFVAFGSLAGFGASS